MQVLYSLFFFILNFIFFIKINKRKCEISLMYISTILFIMIIFFVISIIWNIMPIGLLILLILFSLGIIILHYMKEIVNLNNSSVFKNNEEFAKKFILGRDFLVDKFIPFMVFIYQLLLIWMPVIFNNMISDKE
jgi:glucan phosphoethanolaminetransferase (alkaline phosphatase superfamily)